MKKKQIAGSIFAMTALFFLILDGETGMAGARQGLKLCLQTVIPGLLPFFLLTDLLCTSLQGIPFLRPVGRFFRMQGGEALLIPGFLCGYPMGAKAVAGQYEQGNLSKVSAMRMLTFCCNAGPAFFFGILPAQFPRRWMVFSLWGIHLGAALLTARLLPGNAVVSPGRNDQSFSPAAAMEKAVKALSSVCGWILCFRVLTAALDRWLLWYLPRWGQVAVTGLLELTNGASRLSELPSWQLRYLLCAGLTGFGGLCVTMQTASVLQSLPMNTYLKGKVMQSLISLLLAYAVIRGIFPYVFSAALLLLVLSLALEKRSGKIMTVGV